MAENPLVELLHVSMRRFFMLFVVLSPLSLSLYNLLCHLTNKDVNNNNNTTQCTAPRNKSCCFKKYGTLPFSTYSRLLIVFLQNFHGGLPFVSGVQLLSCPYTMAHTLVVLKHRLQTTNKF